MDCHQANYPWAHLGIPDRNNWDNGRVFWSPSLDHHGGTAAWTPAWHATVLWTRVCLHPGRKWCTFQLEAPPTSPWQFKNLCNKGYMLSARAKVRRSLTKTGQTQAVFAGAHSVTRYPTALELLRWITVKEGLTAFAPARDAMTFNPG